MATQIKSSFQKKTKIKSQIRGTKPSIQNAQLLISSGSSSLDEIIGGGIPVGSVFVIEEDKHATFSKILSKYYLTEGIAVRHELFIGSLDFCTEQLVEDLPNIIVSELVEHKANDDEDMTIAWRYQNMKHVDSMIASNLRFSHLFDLSTKIDTVLVKNCKITHWSHSNGTDQQCPNLLDSIAQTLNKGEFTSNQNPEERNILRVCLTNLGSPLWTSSENEEQFLGFLYRIRALLRFSYASCFVTIPTHLYSASTVSKIRHISDICIKLESFAGTSLEKNPSLKEYQGFFRVIKLAAINTLVTHIPPTLDLAFKLRRKKLVIEKLHLPPELDDSTEREQDDVIGCSSGSRKLEF